MKILTVLGTRPEIIRLSRVIELLDRWSQHILVHTGQNYDDRLDGIFFRELGVRSPDVHLGIRGASFGAQMAELFSGIERVLLEQRPDRVLVLGDTNSGLAAIVARRLGIPVYHMEAGNRCYDDRVPEEVNRRIIDHSSTVLLPYTNRSRSNLLREGISSTRVFVTGNPIGEVLATQDARIAGSTVLSDMGLESGKYFVATLHRAENVDRSDRLRDFLRAFDSLAEKYGLPIICSLHPRTRARMSQLGPDQRREARVRFADPLGFHDFVCLQKSAFCVLSDSGTVQEEACILAVPNVTLRDVTERPETVECGSNYLSGSDPEAIVRAVAIVTANPPAWTPPPEYTQANVADTVCRIITSYRVPDLAELEWRDALGS